MAGAKKATRPVLRDILLHQIQRAKNADNLWFFFSGHGMDEHLMPIDGNPNDLQDTTISIQFVTERLRACKAKNVVLVLDMCRNENPNPGGKSPEVEDQFLRQLVQYREGQQGIITLLSCGRGERSYELESLKQSAFTHALLEGLEQCTILKDLEHYLVRRVTELHLESGKTRKQVPLVIPEPGWKYDNLILSHYATGMDVARLKDLAIDAEDDEDIEKAIRLWEQVNLLATDGNDRQRALNRIRGLMGRQLSKTVEPRPDPEPTPPRAIDYQKLRNLLMAAKWEEADQETCNIMGQILGTQSIRVKDLKAYPLESIEEIDRIWAENSSGKFGFKIQAQIWKQCDQKENEFEIRVGWRSVNRTRQKLYKKLTFDPAQSEPGHLPAFFKSWGGGGWSWTAYLLDRACEVFSLSPVDNVPLESENGVDYRTLRDLLKTGKWEAADQETLRVMLKASNRNIVDWLDSNSLKNFPCKDLRTIDQLWVTASNGHFGFSVQKKIWEECGSPMRDNDDGHKFFGRVGWCRNGKWKIYSDLQKKPKCSPVGEFPTIFSLWILGGPRVPREGWGILSRDEAATRWGIFSRTKDCEL